VLVISGVVAFRRSLPDESLSLVSALRVDEVSTLYTSILLPVGPNAESLATSTFFDRNLVISRFEDYLLVIYVAWQPHFFCRMDPAEASIQAVTLSIESQDLGMSRTFTLRAQFLLLQPFIQVVLLSRRLIRSPRLFSPRV